jgi:hypothetical protein
VIGELYANRKLWDDFPAEAAAAESARSLSSVLARQREVAMKTIVPADRGLANVIAAPFRWLLTIGALLWFPLVQPILERILVGSLRPTIHDIAVVIVPLLGSSYLLHSAAFLVIWFIALWMILRWDTHRRVNRLIQRWATGPADGDESLNGACLRWLDELLESLRMHVERTGALSRRVDELRKDVGDE